MTPKAALKKALEIVGGPSALSRELRITSQAVSQWRRAPARQVLKIERITGVSRHELRPDFYPREHAEAAE